MPEKPDNFRILWRGLATGFLALAIYHLTQRLAGLVTQATPWQAASLGSSFLLALFVGFAAATRWRRDTSGGFFVELGLLAALLMPVTWWFLSPLLPALVAKVAVLDSWWRVMAYLFVVNLLLLAPTAFFLGATVAATAIRPLERRYFFPGLVLGLASAWTLLGTLLVPLLGTLRSVSAAVAIAAFASLLQRRSYRSLSSVILILALLATALTPDDLLERSLNTRFGPLLALSDAAEGIAFVTDEPDRGRLLRLGDGRAAGAAALKHEDRLLAHLPLFLHPEPANILLVGLGTGETLRAASAHPGLSITLVEEKVDLLSLRRFFDDGDLPRFTYVRGEIPLGEELNTDVLVVQLPAPTSSAFDYFFSNEFLSSAASSLGKRGVFATGLDVATVPDAERKALLEQILTIFPHVSLWAGHSGFRWTIIASRSPIDPNLRRMRRAWTSPAVAEQLRAAGRPTALHLLGDFLMADEDVRAFLDSADPTPVPTEGFARRIGRQQSSNYGFTAAASDEWTIALLGGDRVTRAAFARVFERVRETQSLRRDVVVRLQGIDEDSLSREQIREVLSLITPGRDSGSPKRR